MEEKHFHIELFEYMGSRIENMVKGAVQSSVTRPKEAAIIMKYLMAGKNAKIKRDRYEKNGEHIPSFLIASITGSCNLHCKGCYAWANHTCGEERTRDSMSAEKWDDIFTQAEALGILFILLAGGEPLLRRDVLKIAVKHDRLLFPVFTNGTLLDSEYGKLFDKNRNLVPVLSLEGNQQQTNDRRGAGTYQTLVARMDRLKSNGIPFAASVTVTTENLQTVTGTDFVEWLSSKGCRVLLFVEYVPIDKQTGHLALTEAERTVLERSRENLRTAFEQMIFLSFPGDEKYTGGCLAAGRSFFHINANGNAEPCPFSPYSDINLRDHTLLEAIHSHFFEKLKENGLLDGEHKGGCLLFEREHEVARLLADCRQS